MDQLKKRLLFDIIPGLPPTLILTSNIIYCFVQNNISFYIAQKKRANKISHISLIRRGGAGTGFGGRGTRIRKGEKKEKKKKEGRKKKTGRLFKKV
jgi:hypothetical protein